MSIVLKDKRSPFNDDKISNSELFNESLRYLINDLNSLLKDAESVNSQIERYLVLFDMETVEQLRFKINQLEKRYNSYVNLYNKENCSALIKCDFNSESDRLAPSLDNIEFFYSDPKVPKLKYSEFNFLFINGKPGTLQLPVDNDVNVVPDKVTLIHPGNLGTFENFYYTKDTPDPVSLELDIDFRELSKLSYFSFSPSSFYPFNVKGVYYFESGAWVLLPNTQLSHIFAATELCFGPVTTTKLKIEFELVSCKSSNRIIKYSNEELTKTLLQEKNLYYSLDDYSTETTDKFNAFIFHFGISDIRTGYRSKKNQGIFVSNEMQLKEPAHFYLEATELNNNGDISTEYYIYKRDYNKKGQMIHSAVLPILPAGKNTINEVLLSLNGIANLSFYPEGNIVVKRNGIAMYPYQYIYDPVGNVVKLGFDTLFGAGPVYTAEYVPLFIDKSYPVPAINPHGASLKTIIFSPKDGTASDNKIQFVSPYLFKPNTVAVIKNINGEDDLSAPDLNAGIGVSGRLITFDFDTTSYPKLLGTEFHISGELLDGSLVEDQLYYYNSDNSLVVNWEAFQYLREYDYSLVNITAIIRRTKESYNEDEFAIGDISLYSNNFNDLLLSADNIKGII
jgi:hypothetical protein